MCVWAAQARKCALLCALIWVLSYVCSHMCAFICVLSSVCSPMCALTCVLSYVCSHMCARICLLPSVCSHLCALICLLSCALICPPLRALICVSSSSPSPSSSSSSPPQVSSPFAPLTHCLGSLAGIICTDWCTCEYHIIYDHHSWYDIYDITWTWSETIPGLVQGKIKAARIETPTSVEHPILMFLVDVPWCFPKKSYWNLKLNLFPGKETAEALVALWMVRASDAWPRHSSPNIPLFQNHYKGVTEQREGKLSNLEFWTYYCWLVSLFLLVLPLGFFHLAMNLIWICFFPSQAMRLSILDTHLT